MARRRGFFQRFSDAVGRFVHNEIARPIEKFMGGTPAPRRREPSKRRARRPQSEFKRRQRQAQRQPQRQSQRDIRVRPPRRRPYDPWSASWRRHMQRGPGYLDHRDFMQEVFYTYDISGDRQIEMWRDYVKWIVKPGQKYKRTDPRGPFWRKYGISPASWDWQAWREAMAASSPTAKSAA